MYNALDYRHLLVWELNGARQACPQRAVSRLLRAVHERSHLARVNLRLNNFSLNYRKYNKKAVLLLLSTHEAA